VATILGTRPEIIKCSPLLPQLDAEFEHVLIHTGQHYDETMDGSFFRDLQLRKPDHNLGVGSGSHGQQLAKMLDGLEPILAKRQPDLVLVQGDTNSTLAGALAAVTAQIPVAHLEAGCRSFNRSMPEEVNRVIVDHISGICLAPDRHAMKNLRQEGIPASAIAMVGSTGIDACLRASTLLPADSLCDLLGVQTRDFLVATIHRAENTTVERLGELLGVLADLSSTWPVVFPVHPRTRRVMGLIARPRGITYLEPLSYPHMMLLLRNCRALLTDSGGLQEEAAVLGVPTFILRDETEWMAFVEAGRHRLVGTEREAIIRMVRETLRGGPEEERMRKPVGMERAGATERVLVELRRQLDMIREGSIPWKPLVEARERGTQPVHPRDPLRTPY
jgi:UDP-N-acetylglucosamine 2-epimerase (non-hydrolysing)